MRWRTRTGLAAIGVAALASTLGAPANAAPHPADRANTAKPAGIHQPADLTGWTQVSRTTEFTPTSNEGIATVTPPGGSPSTLIRGTLSVPPELSLSNWGHIGDPDSRDGYVFDDFQYSGSDPTSKLFRVTTPDGTHYDYTHPLDPGEEMNNSWVAVSPDGQWMVNGEWDTMNRFLVFPAPILNSAVPAGGGTLATAFQLDLDHPVRDVQGCTFFSATELLCSADDPDTDLFPTAKQLLRVDLPSPLGGSTITGHVTSLGELPLNSACSGNFEVEGDDYDPGSGDFQVLIVQPGVCAAVTDLYTFHQG